MAHVILLECMLTLSFPALADEMGTAEHILECISRVEEGGGIEEQKSLARMDKLAEAANQVKIDLGIKKGEKHLQRFGSELRNSPRAGLLRQFRLLLNRSFREMLRGKGAIIIKIVQQVTLGLIYGGIYGLGTNQVRLRLSFNDTTSNWALWYLAYLATSWFLQASIGDRIGLLSLIAIGAANMAMAGTIRSFPKEKAIVSTEMSAKLYKTFPYFVAKAISEIPLIGAFNAIFCSIIYNLAGLQPGKFRTFLGLTSLHSIASEAAGLLIGSISSSSDMALALFPPVIVLNIIFDGKNISEENTPKLLRWIPKLGLIRWGFEGLALNEFEGLKFDTSGPRRGPVVKTGEEALDRFGLLGKSVGDVMRAQSAIIGACWLASYMGLSLTRQRYLVMRPPNNENGSKTKMA
jgi:ABC-type multidrug transport system permease subunit